MPKFFLIALNGPTDGEGDEATYNKWYNEVHAADLLSCDGAKSVRRFKTIWQNRVDKPYVNITEFEADSAEEVMKELTAKASSFPPEIDRTTSISILAEEITQG